MHVIQGDGSFDSTPQYNVAFSIGGGKYTRGDTAANKQSAFDNAQNTANRFEGLKLSPEHTKTSTDLLSDNTAAKQALADAERAKEAKRNSGTDNQDTFNLTGSNSEADQAASAGAQDLFAAAPAVDADTEQTGVDVQELTQLVNEFDSYQQSMLEDDFQMHHLFDSAAKNKVVRLQDKVKVYNKDHGWMTVEQAMPVYLFGRPMPIEMLEKLLLS